jgi:hypothetical protein
MANLIAELVQKTTALVEATTKTVGTCVQLSKIVASDIAQTTKTTGEYLTGVYISVYERVVQEGVNTLEYIQNLFGKNVEDQVGAADSVDTGFGKMVEDQLDLQEVYESNFGKFVTDSLNITDDVNGAAVDDDQVAAIFKIVSDPLVLSEYTETVFNKQTADTLNISDVISTAMGFSRSLAVDQFNVNDFDDVIFNKQSVDSLNISNPGIILNQNYGSNYFLQDYVGVSRTIS